MRCFIFIFSVFFLLMTLSCSGEDMDLEVPMDVDTVLYDSVLSESIVVRNGYVVIMERNTYSRYLSDVWYWMDQITGKESGQGGDFYNGLFCQFRINHTYLDIIDVVNKTAVTTIALKPLGSAYHCNNADFSNVFYDEKDLFPLLYSSHQGKEARCLLVDRFFLQQGRLTLETIQRIDFPHEDEEPLQYTPDAIVDKDNNCIYVYSGNTIPITDLFIYKFRLPSVSEGERVKLSKDDILEKYVLLDDPVYYKQGATIKDGVIYLVEGVPSWGTDNVIRMIDVNHQKYEKYNLTRSFNVKWEPEDVFFYNDDLYVAANRSGIYRLPFQ